MSPFEDEDRVLRVRSRMRDFTLFTQDNKPAITLPNTCRYTKLLMERACRKGHVGTLANIAKFWMAGFWTSQAGKLAQKV